MQPSEQPDATGTQAWGRRVRRTGRRARKPPSDAVQRNAIPASAVAACLVGTLYAAVSVYWGVGGTWLVDTVSRTLVRHHSAGALLADWGAAVLKLVAAALPLAAIATPPDSGLRRRLRLLAWAAAAILTVYGLVLTVVGLLVQSGAITTSRTADHRALAWHAYLWDPWFLLWGMLAVTALIQTRRRRA